MHFKWVGIVLLVIPFHHTAVLAEPAKPESVKKLMAMTGGANLGVQMMNQMISALKKIIPQAPESFWQEIMAQMDTNEMIELIIPIYQKHFLEEDIQSIIEFHQSPVGQKLSQKQPQIIQESMRIGQQWGKNIARRVIDKYKAQESGSKQ